MTRFLTGHFSNTIRAAGSAALLTVLTGACGGSEPGLARGELLFDTCSPCHGDEGAGNQSLGAPAIAGGSAWYLTDQLLQFQGGVRGYHHTDTEGLRMRPMSRALFDDTGDIESVVEYVVSLPIPDPPGPPKGAMWRPERRTMSRSAPTATAGTAGGTKRSRRLRCCT